MIKAPYELVFRQTQNDSKKNEPEQEGMPAKEAE